MYGKGPETGPLNTHLQDLLESFDGKICISYFYMFITRQKAQEYLYIYS